VLLTGIAAWGAAGKGEEAMCVPMGSITIAAPAKAERPPVQFPHGKHFAYSCNQCHHGWTGPEPIASCSTGGCHDLAKAPEKPATGKLDKTQSIRYFKEAFHQSCIGCHKANKIKNAELERSRQVLKENLGPTGPTGCIECHSN
jgi:hypothetical protein